MMKRLAPLRNRPAWLPSLLLLSVCSPLAWAQQSFPSPQAAAKALYTAAKSSDTSSLMQIFGPNGKELVSSGDDVADENERQHFVTNYAASHRVVPDGSGKYILQVGASAWPLPIPLVKSGDGWSFDTDAGKQEILYRRVGRNEEDAIRVCRAVIEAERAYAAEGHDGNPPGIYTRKLLSDPGTEDGLYWNQGEGAPASPGGPLLAEAQGDGYEPGTGKHQPFHGYLYRILTAQGPHGHNGARDYLVDGKLKRGFAIVAYPVDYRSSGVMTFIVNQHGTVYQKDLGNGTMEIAKAMTAFDPDPSWKITQ